MYSIICVYNQYYYYAWLGHGIGPITVLLVDDRCLLMFLYYLFACMSMLPYPLRVRTDKYYWFLVYLFSFSEYHVKLYVLIDERTFN